MNENDIRRRYFPHDIQLPEGWYVRRGNKYAIYMYGSYPTHEFYMRRGRYFHDAGLSEASVHLYKKDSDYLVRVSRNNNVVGKDERYKTYDEAQKSVLKHIQEVERIIDNYIASIKKSQGIGWQSHAENLTEHSARDYERYYKEQGYEVKVVPSKRYAGRFDMYIKRR